VTEPDPADMALTRLTSDERALYEALRSHAFDPSVRLETNDHSPHPSTKADF
jgi:hypothetical protein